MKFPLLASLFFALLFLSSCKTDLDKFNEQASDFAKDDQRIDQQEYETLTQGIQTSDDRGFRTLKNESGEVDHTKVAAYLKKYFDAKGTPVADIWQPGTVSGTSSNFNVSVFLENSASMDGYVDANSTAFKATMNDLLTNLENFQGKDTLNLNYINSTIIPVKAAASKTDIADFYQNLNTANFKTQGGTRGSSDISEILSQILNRQHAGELSVLVSDFVFSPGGQDAVKYLEGQRSQIRSEFISARQKNSDLAVAVLQGQAQFEGTYYDRTNRPPHHKINKPRPYYVWVIGTAAQIQSVLNAKIFEDTHNGFKNKLVIQNASEVSQPPFKVLLGLGIGKFKSNSPTQGFITDAEAARDDLNKGAFEFNVAVDFSKSIQEPSYFLDTANYNSVGKYTLRVKPITDNSNESLKGYSHILTLRTTEIKEESLKIEVLGKVPSWVRESSSEDDTKIETDADEHNKTFGFSYLVEGVSNAFYPQSKTNSLYSIPLTIKK